MEKQKFKDHLIQATEKLMVFTKDYCFNDFSNNYKYLIVPNSRTIDPNDEHLNEVEVKTLKTWNKYEGKSLSIDEVIDLFHHDNKVPVWINISVFESQSNQTIIELFCCRRLREEKELMHQGLHPFHLQVAMPPDNFKIERDGKFDINWRKRMARQWKKTHFKTKLKRLFG
jgi:hypothetical protein